MEGEVEIGQELPFGKPGVLDSSLDAPLDESTGLDGEEALYHLGDAQSFRRRSGQLGVKSLLHPKEFEGLEVFPDSVDRFVHRFLR